jgi:hypothetical protein
LSAKVAARALTAYLSQRVEVAI